jgi:hypothetical protein
MVRPRPGDSPSRGSSWLPTGVGGHTRGMGQAGSRASDLGRGAGQDPAQVQTRGWGVDTVPLAPAPVAFARATA